MDIDRELLAIRTEELKPKFLAKVAKLAVDAGDKTRAAFAELLNEFNPVPVRMTRLVPPGWRTAKTSRSI